MKINLGALVESSCAHYMYVADKNGKKEKKNAKFTLLPIEITV